MYRTAYEERVWTGTGVVISDWYRLGLVLLAAAVVLGVYALPAAPPARLGPRRRGALAGGRPGAVA